MANSSKDKNYAVTKTRQKYNTDIVHLGIYLAGSRSGFDSWLSRIKRL